MPWSDTDYLQWGNTALKAMGTVKDGMSLHPTEVATLKSIGWNEVSNSKVGYSYENGNQKMVFYPSGFTGYWSDKNGQPTQTWQEIEMPIRWLWKNKGSVPSSEAHRIKPYSAVINTLEAYGHKWHEETVQFVHEDDPLDTIIFMSNGEIYHYDGTGKSSKYKYVHDLLHALDFGKGSVHKPNATGDMPWSNMNYEHSKAAQQMGKDPVYTTITLYSIEEETMKKMGIHRLENSGVKWYEKTGEGQHIMFFADGHASITDTVTGTEVEYFDTVKEAMQFLWNKYMPFIEESFFKDLANVLLTHPDAAKMLM